MARANLPTVAGAIFAAPSNHSSRRIVGRLLLSLSLFGALNKFVILLGNIQKLLATASVAGLLCVAAHLSRLRPIGDCIRCHAVLPAAFPT